MRGEGGSNVDREGGGERDKPHLDDGFQWSEEGLSSVGSTHYMSVVLRSYTDWTEEQLKRWTDGTRRTTRPGADTDRHDC